MVGSYFPKKTKGSPNYPSNPAAGKDHRRTCPNPLAFSRPPPHSSKVASQGIAAEMLPVKTTCPKKPLSGLAFRLFREKRKPSGTLFKSYGYQKGLYIKFFLDKSQKYRIYRISI
jgi:hypothetical protein